MAPRVPARKLCNGQAQAPKASANVKQSNEAPTKKASTTRRLWVACSEWLHGDRAPNNGETTPAQKARHALEKRPCRSRACEPPPPIQTETPPEDAAQKARRGSHVTAKLKRPKCVSQTYEKPLSWARITNDRKCRVALGRLQRLVTRRPSPERRRDHTAPDALQELEIRPGRSRASALPPPDQTETPPPTCNRAAPRGSGVTKKLKREKCVLQTYEKPKPGRGATGTGQTERLFVACSAWLALTRTETPTTRQRPNSTMQRINPPRLHRARAAEAATV